MTVNYEALKQVCTDLLIAIGEDPNRAGLQDTPRRFASFWKEFIEYDPGNHDTMFESVEADQLVAVREMRVWSMCEHHALPFYCDVTIAYKPGDQVLGLSKFARIAHKYAHQLQIQERLMKQIADDVSEIVGSPDVAVIGHGAHLCMIMRGIRTDGLMTTSVMRGEFRANPLLRQELLTLLRLHDGPAFA
jgi:GTP cyclohydrolase IA